MRGCVQSSNRGIETLNNYHICQNTVHLELQLTFYLQSTSLKSFKALAPLLDRVLVQRIKAETKTAGGIFLPESSVKELNEARVLAVGPGGLDKDGKTVSPVVKAGDKVLLPSVSITHNSSRRIGRTPTIVPENSGTKADGWTVRWTANQDPGFRLPLVERARDLGQDQRVNVPLAA